MDGVPEGWEVVSTPQAAAPPAAAPPPPAGIPEGWEIDSMPTSGPGKPSQEAGAADQPVDPKKPERPPDPNAEPTDEQIPGYLDTFKSAVSRKATEAAANLAAGTQVLLPKGMGGKTLQESIQDGDVHPETHDYINKMLGQNVTEGWSNPRWWVAQMGANVGGVAPGLAAAGAASMTPGGPLAGIAAFAGEAAVERIVPAYKAAIAAGLSPEQAATRAGIDSGIAAAFATGMGMVGKFNVTRSLGVEETVAKVLTPKIMEAMVQLGVVQPGLMAGQDIATTLSHGESPDAHQILTDMVVGGLGGLAIHETFRGLDKVQEWRRGKAEGEGEKPSAEDVAAAAEAQRPTPGFARTTARKLAKGTEPAAPVGPPSDQEEEGFETNVGGYSERDVTPAWVSDRPHYFNSVAEDAIDGMPDKLKGADLINYLKGRGVKDSEINDLDLRGFLKDSSGQISKKDLQAWVEANQVKVWEKTLKDPSVNYDPMEQANLLYDNYSQQFGSHNLSQWSPRAQRHFQQVKEAALAEQQQLQDTAPKYRGQLLPGLNNEPEEITFRTPYIPPTRAAIEERARQNRIAEIKAIQEDQPGRKLLMFDQLPEKMKAQGREAALRDLQKDDPNAFVGSHYSDPNTFAHARVTFGPDRDGVDSAVIHELQSDAHQLGAKEGWSRENRTSHLPFKSNWNELAIKRLIQTFADRGIKRIYMLNGDQVGMRLGLHDADGNFLAKDSRDQLAGARMNYEKKNWGLLEKWAKKFGSQTGTGRFNMPEDMYQNLPSFIRDKRRLEHKEMGIDMAKVRGDMRYVTMNPSIATHIRQVGMPLHEGDVKGPRGPLHSLSEGLRINGAPERLVKAGLKIEKAMKNIAVELKMGRGIQFNFLRDPNGTFRGRMTQRRVDPLTGNWELETNLSLIHTEEDLYAAMSHELGHAIKEDMFDGASDAEKAGIKKAFRDFRARMNKDDLTVGDVRRMRDNAISEITGARDLGNRGWTLDQLEPGSRRYLLHFDEWMSEQVAKWMQTDARPLGVVEKFFKKVANKIKAMIMKFKGVQGRGPINPQQAVADFLNKAWDRKAEPWAGRPLEQFERDSQAKNAEAIDKEGTEAAAVPQQDSTASGREILKNLPPQVVGQGEAMGAHADRMNAFYDLFTSLPQVQELNKRILQLANYTDGHRIAYREIIDMQQAAHSRVEQWKRLSRDMQEKLTGFIQDYANVNFKLPHTEDGEVRRPNNEEFAALVKKWGLDKRTLDVFNGTVQDFDGFLERYRKLLVMEAQKIKDPAVAANNISNINATIDKVLSRPFYPLTRFGKYLITVYDSNGKIRHSEQTNSLRRQRQIVEALKKSTDRLPGDQVLPGMVPKDAMPFLGMPPGLIDLIADKLSLSDTQKGVLDQLRYDYAPGHSFKHQFREMDLLPGYSTDFMRNYAHFFFHGARHITRVKWVDFMRDQINSVGSDEVRLSRIGDRDGAVKLDKIKKFMDKHFQAWVDPKSDWAALRGLMFHWYLGFNPASAAVNLTQTPLMTYPWLASTFGDFKAGAALLRESTRISNYFKKASMLAKEFDPQSTALDRALAEGIRQGTISETQAHQLAAVSEDRNLMRFFGNKAERGWLKFGEMSSWMFEMTEQANRRLAFAAAHNLAYNSPDHAAVKEAVAMSPLSYQRLLNGETVDGRRWTPQEAGAFLAAQRAVNMTQFEYAQYARPRIMRGPIGSTALIFKLFTQNTVFNLMSHPGMLVRWMAIMGALGGMQGLLGAENVNGVIKALGWQVFGKDWDLEDEVRSFAHDVLNDRIGADLLLHGASVRGFGLPAVMHSMGFNAFPTVDMSRSIGVGDVLGFDPTKPLQPTKAPREEEFRQMERAAGAAFALPMSLYDFAASGQDISKLKSYESLMPRFFGNLSKAYRYWSQGMETNRAGNAVIKFDPSDTENMMEILAQSAGFQPRRKTEAWEKTAGITQAITYWDLRRAGLMRQFADAVKRNDDEGKKSTIEAIRNYNQKLPPEALSKSITSKELRSSVEQRMQVKARQEAGLPATKSNIPIAKALEPYYPSGWDKNQIGAQGVK